MGKGPYDIFSTLSTSIQFIHKTSYFKLGSQPLSNLCDSRLLNLNQFSSDKRIKRSINIFAQGTNINNNHISRRLTEKKQFRRIKDQLKAENKQTMTRFILTIM